jgi:hypothetical protein
VALRRALVTTSLLVTVLAGCNGTSSSTSCRGSVCTVNLSGEQTVEIEIGRFERDLRVRPIEADAVTVSARGDQARLGVGDSADIAGLTVVLVSLSGRDVTLEVRRS